MIEFVRLELYWQARFRLLEPLARVVERFFGVELVELLGNHFDGQSSPVDQSGQQARDEILGYEMSRAFVYRLVVSKESGPHKLLCEVWVHKPLGWKCSTWS